MAEPDRDRAAMAVLSDGHALLILQAITGIPRTASEIVRATDLPPAACYRRLRLLVEAGLAVPEEAVVGRNGKPARRYVAVVSGMRVVFADGELFVNFDLRGGGVRKLLLRLPAENP